MPSLHIVRESQIIESFRVAQVRGMFDYSALSSRHQWDVAIPSEEKPWQIGLIAGPSGSGKTTIAGELFRDMRLHKSFDWPSGAVVDGFPQGTPTKDICAVLNAVGFSSPPSWLKPFHVLSNGQKFRAELARCLIEDADGFVFDEFTSVVDRDVAKIGCAAVEKAIRSTTSRRFVAVSCHYDIIDWLQPDWIYDAGANRFDWRTRRRRPEIKLDIHQTSTAAWEVFRQHHYLDHHIHRAAACYLATWNEKPIAFSSVLHFPHPTCARFKREHRTVVLPDFQGVGIGNALSEFVASLYIRAGFRFISTTSSPAMMMHRSKSKKWKCTHYGHNTPAGKSRSVSVGNGMSISCRRNTASFEYIGP